MSICPIISNKDNLLDCIGEKCSFFDGCMLLAAYNISDKAYDKAEEAQDDADYCRSEIQTLRSDVADIGNNVETIIKEING